MDKTNLYIQKLIVLFLVFSPVAMLFPVLTGFFLLPASFFLFGFLVSRITGEKPDYLYGLSVSNEFLNRKSGFWLLFKWILILFGLIYDVFAWTIFGVYILFTLILDFILLIKTIIFRIIYAIIWFLKLYVPAIVFLYRMAIYYLFRWNWWIYKLSFNNIRKSLNRNFYFISFWGGSLMLFVILLFYGVGVLMGTPEIFIVGAVFSLLPLVWSYGEISALRLRNEEHNSYSSVRNNFRSGFDAVRAVLSYFIIFLLLALTEVVFNILGWIPQIGFSFMGLALNINTLASLILLFVFVILIFSKLIMPPHVVYHKDFVADFNGSINFLGVIGRRFFRYVVSSISTSFFGAVVIVIPSLIVFISIVITLNIKDSLLDTRIDILSRRENVLEGAEKYKSSKELERMEFYKAFPKNVVSSFKGLKFQRNNIQNLKSNIEQGEKEIATLSLEFSNGIDSLNKTIESLKNKPMADSDSETRLLQLQALKQSRLESFSEWRMDSQYSISRMKIDLADKKGIFMQLPVVFLLTIIWLALSGGLVLAFLISYLGNVYFELYNLREDGKPVYFWQVASDIKASDRNQPLLGFTLLFISGLVLAFFKVIAGAILAIGF
jgi:hypothetical protein